MRVLRRISGLLAVGALAAIGLVRASDDVDVLVFRSSDEFASLSVVLNDPTSWNTLHSLSRRYAVWSVFTVESPAEGENGADRASDGHVHYFRFGSRKGISSRRFQVAIRTVRGDEGEIGVVETTANFVTRLEDFEDNVSIQEPIALEVFRRFLEHPSVRADLADSQLESVAVASTTPGERGSTVDVRVITPDDPEAGTRDLRYRLGFDRVSGSIEWIERAD